MEKEALSSLKYVVILALVISGFQILCTEGRQIKSLDQQEVVSNKKEEMPMSPTEAPTSCIGFHDSAVANNDNYFQPMHTGSSPGIGHQLVDDSTGDHEGDIPKSLGATPGLEHSITASTKDFQPTETGSSPGIGHPKFLGATYGLEHSVTPSTKDFQPIAPGVIHASKRKN